VLHGRDKQSRERSCDLTFNTVAARFADTGGAQTRYAQTLRAFPPVSAALLGHTTRPEETAETMSPLLRADQLAALRQGRLINESAHPWGRAPGVDPQSRRHAAQQAFGIIWKNQFKKG